MLPTCSLLMHMQWKPDTAICQSATSKKCALNCFIIRVLGFLVINREDITSNVLCIKVRLRKVHRMLQDSLMLPAISRSIRRRYEPDSAIFHFATSQKCALNCFVIRFLMRRDELTSTFAVVNPCLGRDNEIHRCYIHGIWRSQYSVCIDASQLRADR